MPIPDMAQDDPAGAGTERALLRRLRRGDEQAFDQLVRAWSRPMLRVARGFVSTDASAQEVVQDTWLGVIRGLAGFEGRSSLRTWVFRILVNIAKTRGVQEQRTTPLSAVAADEDTGPTVDPSRFRDPGDPEWPRHWTPAGTPRRWDTDPEAEVIRGEIRDVVSAAVGDLLASRAAMHIDNARLYTSEHDTAVTLQRSLLPRDIPAVAGLDIAYRLERRWA